MWELIVSNLDHCLSFYFGHATMAIRTNICPSKAGRLTGKTEICFTKYFQMVQ